MGVISRQLQQEGMLCIEENVCLSNDDTDDESEIDLVGTVQRTKPNCSRCKNHGLKIPLNGHKRYCLFWNCDCKKCQQTDRRRKKMAADTAKRRAEKQHAKKMAERQRALREARRRGAKLPERPIEYMHPIVSPNPQISVSSSPDNSSSHGPGAGSGTAGFNSPSDYQSDHSGFIPPAESSRSNSLFTFAIPSNDEPSSNESRIDLKSALRDLEDLLKRESYPVEISTLLYLVVKETPEPRKAFDRIVKAQTELNPRYSSAINNNVSRHRSSSSSRSSLEGCPPPPDNGGPSSVGGGDERVLPPNGIGERSVSPVTHEEDAVVHPTPVIPAPTDMSHCGPSIMRFEHPFPFYIPPHAVIGGRSSLLPASFHPSATYAFAPAAPLYHHQYAGGLAGPNGMTMGTAALQAAAAVSTNSFPLSTATCRFSPYPRRFSTLRSPTNFLSFAHYADDEKQSRLNFESLSSLPATEERPPLMRPSNLCIRETSPSYTTSPLDTTATFPINLTK